MSLDRRGSEDGVGGRVYIGWGLRQKVGSWTQQPRHMRMRLSNRKELPRREGREEHVMEGGIASCEDAYGLQQCKLSYQHTCTSNSYTNRSYSIQTY